MLAALFAMHGVFCFSQCVVTINSFPYNEDFETSTGNWTDGGASSDWAWGTPAKPVISSAGNGVKCWIVGGLNNSSYNTLERSYVKSPCFDFTAIANPYITFKIFWETEKQYDGANFQYSTDSGNTWTNVSSYNGTVDCLNDFGYNSGSITNLTSLANPKEGWSGNIQATVGSCQGGSGSNGWRIAKQSMPYLAGLPKVVFRFTFGAGSTCNNYDGFAFDDVRIEEAPPSFTLATTSQDAGCNIADGTATVQVNGGNAPYIYVWNPNVSSAATATNLNAGNYIVTVTDASNCSKSVSFSVAQSPPVNFTLTGFNDTCSRQVGAASLQVTSGTAPYNYVWMPTGINAPVMANLASGTYTVLVTDSKNCSQSQSVFIDDVGQFTINLGDDKIECGDFKVTLSPGNYVSYQWQDSSNNSTYEAVQEGIYWVSVYNSFGCSASDTIEIINDCNDDVFVPNSFTPNNDALNESFMAIGEHIKDFSMLIYNRWGQLVFESYDFSSGWNGTYNNRQLPQGLYAWLIRFSKDGIIYRTKRGTVLLVR